MLHSEVEFIFGRNCKRSASTEIACAECREAPSTVTYGTWDEPNDTNASTFCEIWWFFSKHWRSWIKSPAQFTSRPIQSPSFEASEGLVHSTAALLVYIKWRWHSDPNDWRYTTRFQLHFLNCLWQAEFIYLLMQSPFFIIDVVFERLASIWNLLASARTEWYRVLTSV